MLYTARAIDFIQRKLMPIVERHAISGHARINSEAPLFDNPVALAMLIDIFSERGYHAVVDVHRIEIPETVDLKTGKMAWVHKFPTFTFGPLLTTGGNLVFFDGESVPGLSAQVELQYYEEGKGP